MRAGNATHVMACVRNLAISIHRLAGASNIAKSLCSAARHPNIARQRTGLLKGPAWFVIVVALGDNFLIRLREEAQSGLS